MKPHINPIIAIIPNIVPIHNVALKAAQSAYAGYNRHYRASQAQHKKAENQLRFTRPLSFVFILPPVFPSAPCKIRKLDRSGAVCDGLLRQRRDRHPGRRVIYVDGHRLMAKQAIEEDLEFEQVHPLVRAGDALPQVPLPNLVIILFRILFSVPALKLSPGEFPELIRFPVQEYGVGRLLIHALGAPHRKAARIIPRQRRIEHQGHGLAVGAAQHGRDDVSLLEGRIEQFLIIRLFVRNIGGEPCRLARRRGQGYEPVAPIDVQHLCDRAKVVRGIVLAVAAYVIPEPIMPVFPAESDLLAQIMAIAAGAVNYLAQNAQTLHIQDHHFPPAEAAVFQKHKRRLCLLVGIDQPPAVLYGIGSADLHGNRLAPEHAVSCDFHMRFPGGHNDDRVDVFAVHDFFVIGLNRRTDARPEPDYFSRVLRPVLIQIADGSDNGALQVQDDGGQHTAASPAEADHADPNLFVPDARTAFFTVRKSCSFSHKTRLPGILFISVFSTPIFERFPCGISEISSPAAAWSLAPATRGKIRQGRRPQPTGEQAYFNLFRKKLQAQKRKKQLAFSRCPHTARI